MEIALVIIIIMGIYFTNKKKFLEGFQGSKWDNYMTTKTSGVTWKYNGPTTRVEYDFIETHPSGKKVRIAPVTSNSFQTKSLKCNM